MYVFRVRLQRQTAAMNAGTVKVKSAKLTCSKSSTFTTPLVSAASPKAVGNGDRAGVRVGSRTVIAKIPLHTFFTNG